MKTNAATQPTAIETPAPTGAPSSPPAKEPKTATITLTAANGTVLTLRAHRLREGAETFVTTTEGKTTTRGMTISHASFDIAKAHIAASATKAETLGWTRKPQGRGFVAKPDAFSELPKAPKVAKIVKK